MNITQHTLVFDRGCNSKVNFKKVERLKMHYIGALTPSHHEDLIEAAEGRYQKIEVDGSDLEVYREKRDIWDEKRTVLVFISKQLKDGQLRGIYQALEKRRKQLRKLQKELSKPKAKKRAKEKLERRIQKILKGQFMEGLIFYELTEEKKGHWTLNYKTDQMQLSKLEDDLGFRIIVTNRHDWESDKIIKAYHGQAIVEQSFKNIKNPYHLAITPGFHWTDQKIKVHYFICVLGYLLSALMWDEARKVGFSGTLDNLLNSLNGIRLSRKVEISGKKGKPKVTYELEEMSKDQLMLMETLDFSKTHLKPIKIEGMSSYKKTS